MKLLVVLSSLLAVSATLSNNHLVASDDDNGGLSADAYDSYETVRDYAHILREFPGNDIINQTFTNVGPDGCASICDEHNRIGRASANKGFQPCVGFAILNQGSSHPICSLKSNLVSKPTAQLSDSYRDTYFKFAAPMSVADDPTTKFNGTSIFVSIPFTSASETKYSAVGDGEYKPVVPHHPTLHTPLTSPPVTGRIPPLCEYQTNTNGFLVHDKSIVTLTVFKWRTSRSSFDSKAEWAVRVFNGTAVGKDLANKSRLITATGHESLRLLLEKDEQLRLEFGSDDKTSGNEVSLYMSEFQLVAHKV